MAEAFNDSLGKIINFAQNNLKLSKGLHEVTKALESDKKPLFVVQGANDPRVNIDESDQIVSGLRAKGVDVPYMVKYDEGHGFAKEENSIALYKAMMGFYAKHLNKEIKKPIKN